MESENILIQLILISFFCLGWSVLIGKGMILEKLGDKIESLRDEGRGKFSKWIAKPIGGCLPCSSSIVGLTAFILLNYVPFGYVVVLLVSASGLLNPLYYLLALQGQKAEEMEYRLEPRREQAKRIEEIRNNVNKCKGCGNGKENSVNKSTMESEA